MSNIKFDWAKHLSRATYAEVATLSPSLPTSRPPAMYSPDRSWLYLHSQDVDVETSDIEEISQLLELVLDAYAHSLEPGREYNRYSARVECHELCRLLCSSGDDSGKYSDPDFLLRRADQANAAST